MILNKATLDDTSHGKILSISWSKWYQYRNKELREDLLGRYDKHR